MTIQNWIGSVFALVLLVCLAASPVAAQEVTAGITGVVADSTGGVVPGTTVTIRDVDRGVTYTATSNAQGFYAFPRIPTGTYELRVEAPGFRTSVQSNIKLEVNQRARVDVTMELGAVTETVEVTDAAPLLQTDTTLVSSTITDTQLTELPLRSRNYIILTLLAPGVTTTNPAGFVNDQRTTGGGRPYVNGNRKEANNFLLDGIDNNQVSDNLTSYQPNPDAIGEVKVITNNASAEFGNFQGGIISVNMKGGSNEFHGSLFHYFRNDKLNANAWQRNWLDLPRAPMRYNAFGGTFGGPVLIPKLFNGKDKLFFFANYMGMRRPVPRTISRITVMPTEFRQGDFSRLLTITDPKQLYNPFDVGPDGKRRPFPNNQIPQNLISPAAKALFNSGLYPEPLNNDLRFNQLNASSNQLNLDQGDIRVDARPSDNDNITVRYSHSLQTNPTQNSFPLTFNSFNDSPFKAGVVSWTRSFTPTLVNDFRIGVNRIVLQNGGVDKGYGNLSEEFGIGGVGSDGLLSLEFAQSFNNNIGSRGIGTSTLFANTSYHLADNFTLVRGRHLLKFGGQLLRQHMNTFYAGNNGRTGFLAFAGRFTGIDSSKTGWGDADFLLGLPETLGRGLDTGTWGHRKWIHGLYIQDDWRVSNRLTLNLGLRWENHTPLVEVADRQANFHPFTGELQLAGQDGNSRALYEPFYWDFQPRVGFAWTTVGGAVLRGAYTISSFMEGTGTNLRLPLNPPFNAEFEGRYDSPSFNLPGSTLSQGLSSLTKADPFRGTNIRLWDPHIRPANTQQWNLTIEKQLMAETIFNVGYVGQKGHHLVVPMPYFQRQLLPDGTVQPSPYLSSNPLLKNITQISGTETNGNQQYHSLQSTFRRRMTKGLDLLATYTLSKGMSDAIGYYGEGGQAGSQSAYWQYLYDRTLEWGPTYFDARHIFNFVHIWEVPFGRGRSFGADMPGALDAVLGNWTINGTLTLRSGFPLTIRGPDNSGTLSRGARADRIGKGGTLGQVGLGTDWFDTSAYAISEKGTLGTAGNGTERGPGLSTYDLSLQKSFPIQERLGIELRADFFNLTNTPIFGAPQRSVNSPTFGEINSAQGERVTQLSLRLSF